MAGRYRNPLPSSENYQAILYKKLPKSNDYDEDGKMFYFKQADVAGETVFKATKGLETQQFQPLGGLQVEGHIYEIFTTNTDLDYSVYDKVYIVALDRTFRIEKVIRVTATTYAMGMRRSQRMLARKTPIKLKLV